MCVCNGARVGGCEEAGLNGCPGTACWAWASLTRREEVGDAERLQGRLGLGASGKRHPVGTGRQGHPQGLATAPCRSPSGHSLPLRVPMRHWPREARKESTSADGPFGLLVLHKQTPAALLRCTTHPGDVGVLWEELPQWHCPLLVEFPIPRHLLRDQVRSPLGPLAPVALWGSLCQIP